MRIVIGKSRPYALCWAEARKSIEAIVAHKVTLPALEMRRVERAVKNSRISRFITNSFQLIELLLPSSPRGAIASKEAEGCGGMGKGWQGMG
jgi:hypothetical protein